MQTEFREYTIDPITVEKDKIRLFIDTRQSKKFPQKNRFLTESISPEVFINAIHEQTVVLLNHQPTQIVSNKFETRATDEGVAIDVVLDEKNVFSTTVQSYRDNGIPLSVSFGFNCLEERMINKHREILNARINEISILTVPSQYFSSTRSENTQSIDYDELQNLIKTTINQAFESNKQTLNVEYQTVTVDTTEIVEKIKEEIQIKLDELDDIKRKKEEEIKNNQKIESYKKMVEEINKQKRD